MKNKLYRNEYRQEGSQLIGFRKISQEGLSRGQMMRLLFESKPQLQKFVVMYDFEANALLVSLEVPEDDVEKMRIIASYTGPYINNDDCEIRPVIDDICERYGLHVWNELYLAYSERRKKAERKEAEEKAAQIGSMINKMINDEEYSALVLDNELLMYYIQNHVPKGRRTIRNVVGYETIFVFLLGYLMGNGGVCDV